MCESTLDSKKKQHRKCTQQIGDISKRSGLQVLIGTVNATNCVCSLSAINVLTHFSHSAIAFLFSLNFAVLIGRRNVDACGELFFCGNFFYCFASTMEKCSSLFRFGIWMIRFAMSIDYSHFPNIEDNTIIHKSRSNYDFVPYSQHQRR